MGMYFADRASQPEKIFFPDVWKYRMKCSTLAFITIGISKSVPFLGPVPGEASKEKSSLDSSLTGREPSHGRSGTALDPPRPRSVSKGCVTLSWENNASSSDGVKREGSSCSSDETLSWES